MLSLWEEVDSVSEPQPEVAWQNVWSKEVSLSPTMISYTTDGSLFATCSEVCTYSFVGGSMYMWCTFPQTIVRTRA